MNQLKNGDIVQIEESDICVIIEDQNIINSKEYLKMANVNSYIKLSQFKGFLHCNWPALNVVKIVGNIFDANSSPEFEKACIHHFVPRTMAKTGEWCTKCGNIRAS
jgi:hypothetical protein